MEMVVLFTEAPKNDRLAKSIYWGGHFIYGDVYNCPPRKIDLRKKGILFTETFIIARLAKLIHGDGQTCPPW